MSAADVKCPHCGETITMDTCSECGHEGPEQEMDTCEKCHNRYCDQHIHNHECEE